MKYSELQSIVAYRSTEAADDVHVGNSGLLLNPAGCVSCWLRSLWRLDVSACKAADDRFSGPVSAIVERVIDGDTLAVRVRVWIGQEVSVLVRLAGVDVPEIKRGCEASRSLGGRGQELVGSLVGGREVILTEIASDKYFGRVVARVRTPTATTLPGN